MTQKPLQSSSPDSATGLTSVSISASVEVRIYPLLHYRDHFFAIRDVSVLKDHLHVMSKQFLHLKRLFYVNYTKSS
jgi:hypothetical protein